MKELFGIPAKGWIILMLAGALGWAMTAALVAGTLFLSAWLFGAI